jgi:hypothetical protein
MRAEEPLVYWLSPWQRRAALRRVVVMPVVGGALGVRPLLSHDWIFAGVWLGFVALMTIAALRITLGWTMTSAEGLTSSRMLVGRRFIAWSEVTAIGSYTSAGRTVFYRAIQITTTRRGGRRFLPVPRDFTGSDPEFDEVIHELRNCWNRSIQRQKAGRAC